MIAAPRHPGGAFSILGRAMIALVLGLILFHVAMLALCRHLIRRRHFPFFQQHRAARGKPATYTHFLLLYVSWPDPAMLAAAMMQPGYRRDQFLCALLYVAGLVMVILLAT
ncbi:MAG: hypothetical protein Q4G14_03695 [Paracoccus sp. (in: a-proteobacteria)]|uniref:hypothetical protein n=1 Tax=Paracoccus sp. TaxID=267 RepID=UPI0026E09799|nr:hypothetical protein [Paracoccus sp. (in: a-proteobacteria)]MDO5612330.1 hypothetical protein [Paracoccus sp. (in: a-proteobacteria)]